MTELKRYEYKGNWRLIRNDEPCFRHCFYCHKDVTTFEDDESIDLILHSGSCVPCLKKQRGHKSVRLIWRKGGKYAKAFQTRIKWITEDEWIKWKNERVAEWTPFLKTFSDRAKLRRISWRLFYKEGFFDYFSKRNKREVVRNDTDPSCWRV